MPARRSAKGSFPDLPDSVGATLKGRTAILTIRRAAKRNALNTEVVEGIEQCFERLPEAAKVVILCGEGGNFTSGLDLNELAHTGLTEAIHHSRAWHRAFEKIEFGRVPVIAVLEGAVLGGGLELASTAHIRVADHSAYYALPEGQRGIFVGGGGSVRLPRLIGVARMTDMMLTGRVLNAEEGQIAGISQYLVPAGEGMKRALELAERIAANAPLTNFALIQALPRIASAEPATGLLLESLMAAAAQSDPEAKARLDHFLAKRGGKVERK